MESGFRKSVGRYVLEYLNDEKIDNIRVNHFEDYKGWRREYWINPDAAKKKRLKRNKNISANPTRRIIAWEPTMWKAILRWAKNHSYMNADIPDYVVKKGICNRRLAFTEDKYKKLTSYMRSKAWLQNIEFLGTHAQLFSSLFCTLKEVICWVLFSIIYHIWSGWRNLYTSKPRIFKFL